MNISATDERNSSSSANQNAKQPNLSQFLQFVENFAIKSLNLKQEVVTAMLTNEQDASYRNIIDFIDVSGPNGGANSSKGLDSNVQSLYIYLDPEDNALKTSKNFPVKYRMKCVGLSWIAEKLNDPCPFWMKLNQTCYSSKVSKCCSKQIDRLQEKDQAKYNFANNLPVLSDKLSRCVQNTGTDIKINFAKQIDQLFLDVPEAIENKLRKGRPLKFDTLKQIEHLYSIWAEKIAEKVKGDFPTHVRLYERFDTYHTDHHFYSTLSIEEFLEYYKRRDAEYKALSRTINSSSHRELHETFMAHPDVIKFELENTYSYIKETISSKIEENERIEDLLKVLERNVSNFQMCDFEECKDSIRKMLLAVDYIAYKMPEEFRKSSVLFSLLTCLLNLVLQFVKDYLDPTSITKIDFEDSIPKLDLSIDTCQYVVSLLVNNRDRLLKTCKVDQQCDSEYVEDSARDYIDSSVLLFNFKEFNKRVQEIKTILLRNHALETLEKIEIGGIEGVKYSEGIEDCYKIFQNFAKELQEFEGDVTDINDKCLNEMLANYYSNISLLDTKLCSIFTSAMSSCETMESLHKIWVIISDLIDTKPMKLVMEKEYDRFIGIAMKDFRMIKRNFEKHLECDHESKKDYYDPRLGDISGLVRFTRRIRDSINQKRDLIKAYEFLASDNDDIKMKIKSHDKRVTRLTKKVSEHCENVFNDWISTVESECRDKLDLNLLRRRDNGEFSVNFEEKLTSIMNETYYLIDMNCASRIPKYVLDVFRKNKTLKQNQCLIKSSAESYNFVEANLNSVERKLLHEELTQSLEKIEIGLRELNWNSEECNEYCTELKEVCSSLRNRLESSQSNIRRMTDSISNIDKDRPMYVRKDNKIDTMLYLEDIDDIKKLRYSEIKTINQQIEGLMCENEQILKNDHNNKYWAEYSKHIETIIEKCFRSLIFNDLKYLYDNFGLSKMANNTNKMPIIETQLSIISNELVFTPAISETPNKSDIYSKMQRILSNIINQISGITAWKSSESLLTYIATDEKICELQKAILDKLSQAFDKTKDYVKSFEKYAYFWKEDKYEYNDHYFKDMDRSKPLQETYRETLKSFTDTIAEVSKIENNHSIDNCLRINLKSFKTSLNLTINRWSRAFMDSIVEKLNEDVQNLQSFIAHSTAGLNLEIEESNYDILVTIMSHLLAVKEKQAEIENQFEEFKDIHKILSDHNEEISDDLEDCIDKLPERWEDVKKLAGLTKQKVSSLQSNEVARIRRRITSFDVQQHEYRDKFRTMEAFLYDCKNPYEVIDHFDSEIKDLEKITDELKRAADLFEVNINEFKMVKICRQEITLLRRIWDFIGDVENKFSQWQSEQWLDVDLDKVENECRQFQKQLRTNIDKEARAWDVYNCIEVDVKNMISSIKAVSELQTQSIKPRHWQQVSKVTGIEFRYPSDHKDTTLKELLDLDLHKYEDEVRSIVDRANKEANMGKVIDEIITTWKSQYFEFEDHARTNVKFVRVSEEIIEILEDNQVQLQNMLSSKYIAYFHDEVNEWQTKLGNVDQFVGLWLDLQRTWSHLESIFVGSDDIRKQLPEDSLRFEEINVDFKKIAAIVEDTKKIIDAANVKGIIKSIEDIQERLQVCEKALAEYLETKKLAFPRFYFVSSSDLLDILSNGNRPRMIEKHLVKLFDSLSGLEFHSESDDSSAKGMFAKDGEYVKFHSTCDFKNQQVEVWLMKLLNWHCETIRNSMNEAVACYEEKPREKWITEFPAQVALTASQVWWSYEVNYAFSQLEEGQENAMKEYYKKQISQLNNLISMLVGKLTKSERQKIMTICTIDVHARDVVAKLISQKIDNNQAFTWLSQLRHRWDDSIQNCFVNICDAEFEYKNEYLGNTPRLVVTPLTDRCYITLTQSLHLVMSGAPAGPAGTGKTETTKDLGRSLGIMVYVFNCSEQMDYKSIGNIYKGLAQSGAWGCFDEFNRISVEVLSVVAVQVKCIQDAIKESKKEFNFLGEIVKLDKSVGIFITMNPGYAGRTELPENLKALFRPCAMVVPDFELICEIMLVAEGFIDARLLARKFITLYSLCKELLSKQDHYDWGLRAIKSVLVVAGSLKRSDPERPEDQVLMRALRDFNVPKIVTDDMPVFMGLIGDLFPSLDVPRKRDEALEIEIKKAAQELHLQPEEGFILKVVQLKELFEVRHSVFVIGNAGTGKSCVWKTLGKAYQNMKQKPTIVDLNPKVVTNDELFGVINPATREWKDGLFSTIMRDMTQINSGNESPKWIVLDGDIDPMWIESLNTLMDDNKVLTLASNERISLTPSMRLIFEISHLKTATPATVSRAGILYINQNDLGWSPIISSWIDSRQIQSEKANLTILTDRYVPNCIEVMKSGKFKRIAPTSEISHIQMLCNLLEAILVPENTPPDCTKEIFELYFVFACIWAFGSCLYQDQLKDQRVEFSNWWVSEFKAVKFPNGGTIFDYYIDPQTKKFEHWSNMERDFEFDIDIPLQSTIVYTPEAIKLKYFLDSFIEHKKPLMLVGYAGVGKSLMVQDKLQSLSSDKFAITKVPFNFYTTSQMLQSILEKPLEKKAGRRYAPQGTKQMIYFIDDMNIPEVDNYYTVQPHTLLRQHLDYGHWYDRQKLTLKDISNTQYVSCMNPTAGSFTISPRLQRHFAIFSVNPPQRSSLEMIYSTILGKFFECISPCEEITSGTNLYVNSIIDVHEKVQKFFMPTATKFHYTFNLRDLSNIFQGILNMRNDTIKSKSDFVSLIDHELQRIYSDKFIDREDESRFKTYSSEIMQQVFPDEFKSIIDSQNVSPLIFTNFSNGLTEKKYSRVSNWQNLKKLLTDALENHNDSNAAMNLVLFEDAIRYVCRINRILESPRGNALLIGVGGSGRQSLARLAAFIAGIEVFQISLRKGYSLTDLKTDILELCLKVVVKNTPSMLLMTDSQIADEKFLVVLNDLLASGDVPDLIPDDEMENVMNALRPELKKLGIEDTRDNLWQQYLTKLRKNLKIVLCMSPVGQLLRQRVHKFPALITCSSIIWFHEWPQEALINVAESFLAGHELLSAESSKSLAKLMSKVSVSVSESSDKYLKEARRYNYTTPKSFLEMINLYKNILARKHSQLQKNIERLENGLEKLRSTSNQVDELKSKLAAQEIELAQKTADANALISVVGAETEKVTLEKSKANEEENKVSKINEEVKKKQASCSEDLAKAEPALKAAQEALNTLNKSNLTELKAFGTPPPAVTMTLSAVMILLAPNGKIPKDLSWKAAKATVMSKIDEFLGNLINYDKENIHENCLKAIKPYMTNPEFNPEFVKGKSFAASGLCSWVINIVTFYEIFCDVEPKRMALAQANAELSAANDKLMEVRSKIEKLENSLAQLTAKFEKATSEKMKCQQEAESTQSTVKLANRLVNGLSSENIRWTDSVNNLKEQEKNLPGNVMLVTAFISYLGYFQKKYREELINNIWITEMQRMKESGSLLFDENQDPIGMLSSAADIASWNNNYLPTDRMSIENATILLNSQRWPLMVDPQLQGIKWLQSMLGDKLISISLDQKGYLDTLERVISNGDTCIIENLGEDIDPVLDPIISRNVIKKGRAIKLGDKEIEYNANFRLILHTKLANPHYKPEIQAQCAMINFLVTRDGLEDQLLADVVNNEKPNLEKIKSDLTRQQNEFKIMLSSLEDELLARLSQAEGDFLSDTALVENLEKTKETALEVEEKVKEAKKTEIEINDARELYRPIAARGSLLYFCVDSLDKIHPMYRFSLKSIRKVFKRALEKCTASQDDIKARIDQLVKDVTSQIFSYTNRALFEKDKLIFATQLCFQILLMSGTIKGDEVDTLLRFSIVPNCQSPISFISNTSWGAIKALSNLPAFKNLDQDMEGSSKRWMKFTESECPEQEKLPQEWKGKSLIERMCILRALRSDRLTYALRNFISDNLGTEFCQGSSIAFKQTFQETDCQTPTFFILSPGVDPLKDVEVVGKQLGFTDNNANFHNISLGQGQEAIAENALENARLDGHWVVLQNIHLVSKWLKKLEKILEQLNNSTSDGNDKSNPNFCHKDCRVFVSAEPAGTPEAHVIPQSILENSIKVTNEPPTGMQANLNKALDNFSNETLESCSKDQEFRSILFALCYFHAVVCERRKFGAQGWNRLYPFNTGDLTISVNVLLNYLEANSKVPWVDLRYLFGEIMYGGHITDDLDRRVANTYLCEYMKDDMMDNEISLAPKFTIPNGQSFDIAAYKKYIDENLPPESPILYGLHPNAEIEFLTALAEKLMRTVFECQASFMAEVVVNNTKFGGKESSDPLGANGEAAGGNTGSSISSENAIMTREDRVKEILDTLREKLPESFNIADLHSKVPVEERSPYAIVALQEVERMNLLINEIKVSLDELNLGLKGELSMSLDMEKLSNSLFIDQVPEKWQKKAYASLLPLSTWFIDLILRCSELENWTNDLTQLPSTVWLGALFNPQAFLTAIMQQTARKNQWPLDKMCLQVEVTKKTRRDEIQSPPREGAYISGIILEGAKWDSAGNTLADPKLKDLNPTMPIIFVKAVPVDKIDTRQTYACPLYKTKQRGPTYVWSMNLKSREKPSKWVLGGVAMILQI